MTSSAATTQLGRHLWGSIRDSVTIFAARLPQRPPKPTRTRFGQLCQPFHPANPSHTSPLIHPAKSFSRAYSSRAARPPPRKSCTSGCLLLLGLSPSPSSTNAVVTTCARNTSQKAQLSYLARQIWKQSRQPRNDRGEVSIIGRRGKSSSTNRDGDRNNVTGQPPPRTEVEKPQNGPPKIPESELSEAESIADSMSKYLHLPKMPHRPTKEELLAATNGFLQRLRVRFKWFSIRSMRPWNADEWGAFVSWFLFGHLVWILVGTTTFFSLIILFINTVFAQETLAKWIGDYLTQSAGLTVVFESAIVPRWKDGVITFRNVFVSRRPGQHGKSTVKKGSSNAAAEAAAARQTALEEEADDGNYTQFDVTIDTVNVTLSFLKWWNGKGLLRDVEVKGVRGVIDRTSVVWGDEEVDPLTFRHEHNPGDFELDYFKMEDLLVTVHQPGGFRPFSVSIFSCELPQLRKQWLFYDFLSASHMSGAFDGSLFTIHPRQIHGISAAAAEDRRQDEFGASSAWKKFSRLRIDGLKIDHLNRGVEGPFGWIYEGNVDIVADVMFPADPAEGIGKVVAEFYDKMEEAVTSNRYLQILDTNGTRRREREQNIINNSRPYSVRHDENLLSGENPSAPLPASSHHHPPPSQEEVPGYLVMDLRIHLNNVRAAVPLFNNPHISYVNQALVRPIVAYINAKRTYIPVNCRIVKRVTDFDGSWTVWDCGLMDDTSAEVYSAFAYNVEDQQSRVRRFKRVGLWTVSLVVHALLAGVAGDYM
ncbi:Mitochondrial distribution and morphology protein 31, mitochondrial precursor [Podospora bellae-mahoneyi]|uniref:Mitochondrial distribution and morphology protein 31, mitochondrial n=1 Tax=Podospora bellae-mahoneyi TaxID=2093777 RepID=A0ABR0FJV0_9PEZI|nr:Mitochondrial distribution and morphology protein 31, mitochondrial precursor [Podospora bellae-mahoneyi]